MAGTTSREEEAAEGTSTRAPTKRMASRRSGDEQESKEKDKGDRQVEEGKGKDNNNKLGSGKGGGGGKGKAGGTGGRKDNKKPVVVHFTYSTPYEFCPFTQ